MVVYNVMGIVCTMCPCITVVSLYRLDLLSFYLFKRFCQVCNCILNYVWDSHKSQALKVISWHVALIEGWYTASRWELGGVGPARQVTFITVCHLQNLSFAF